MALSETAKLGIVLAFLFVVGFMAYTMAAARSAERTAQQADGDAARAQVTADVALMAALPPQ
jgi:hypothetical protein